MPLYRSRTNASSQLNLDASFFFLRSSDHTDHDHDRSLQYHPHPQLPGVGKAIIAAALLNSAYSFAWDVKMDWGLGQPGSRKWGLRNTLLISHEDPWPYYAAVAVDLMLRLAWLLRLADGRFRYTDMVLTLELVEVRARLSMSRSCVVSYFIILSRSVIAFE